MQKARLKTEIKKQLLADEMAMLKLAMHFKMQMATIKKNIKNDCQNLTTLNYLAKIREVLKLPRMMEIAEVYECSDSYLSKHN